jgi:enterochelin esterase-like enzyme
LPLFDIVTGDDDALVGTSVTEFEAELNQVGVKHVYTVIHGGTHSMSVWRPALYDFLQQVFKPNDCRLDGSYPTEFLQWRSMILFGLY